MKTFVLAVIAAFASSVMVGCVQINSSDSGSMNLPPTTVGPVDDYRPLYQVDCTRKISASSNIKNLFWIFTWGSDNAFADNASIFPSDSILGKIFPFLIAKETAAKAAFYKACKDAKCDSIVAARYEITFEDYFLYKKISVEVSGFPAKLSGVETVKAQQYYINSNGDVIFLDKYIKPCQLFDAQRPSPFFFKFLR